MNELDHAETIDLRIAEVVAAWMETAEADRPSASDFVDQHPDLAPGLAECLDGLQRIEQGKAELSRNGSRASDLDADEVEFPVIPDYEVLGELGRGGMGVVYEARQTSLDRFVALKVLPFGAVDASAVKRFLREAETVASLTHPGIVPVYAVGVHGGLNWYAMQRIDGCPLSQWFAVSTFASRADAIDEVVRVGIEAAEALQYAHQSGVIHRDVKPGNLLVDTSGKVWLTDFGLARRDVDVTATATGAMLGTPRYMSAEQISGQDEEIDARTDIYSLGATLYEMATGRPPFTSESPLQLLTQIQRDEPTRPRQIDPTIPRTLELVILKCLDKEPQRRYESAAELAIDLKAIRDDKPISARGLPVWVSTSRFLKRNKRQVNAVATSVLATIATLVSLGMLWRQHAQANFGSVQINTPAGLYVANIQPWRSSGSGSRQNFRPARAGANESMGSLRYENEAVESTLVTTPMQRLADLPAGDYVVRMEGEGNGSQTVEMNVTAGKTTELEYIDRRESPPSVDIHNKLAMSLGDGVLAVLGKDAFEVFDSGPDGESRSEKMQVDAMRRFTVPIAELDAGLAEDALTARPKIASDQGDPPLTFAFNAEQMFQGDYNVPRSSFARIARIAESEFDLDADGERDYLVTAARHAAIAAVSSDGSVLWKRHLPMSFEVAGARSRFPKKGMVNEAIVGITCVDDRDDDGTDDFIVNAALFDPSGFSRPYICTLSGRTGDELAVAPLPTINMSKINDWPWSGLLPYRRSWNSDARAARHTRFHHHDRIIKRTSVHGFDNDHWGGNSASSSLYVLPPLILGRHEGRTIAATAIGRMIHFIDTSNGDPVGSPIALKHPICRGPLRVKLSDGALGVVVLTGIPGNAFTKCFLELCVMGESTPRWSVPQNVSAREFVAGAADNAFPWVIDLDNDGSDEILTSIDPDYPSQWPQVQCCSAESGELNWVSQGISGVASVTEHTRAVGDIDRDGHLDFALVGLSARISNADQLRAAGVALFVDFISGRTGERLGYRDEWITSAVEKSPVLEIDSVELYGNELVCSVVYGQVDELKLSSLTVTMDLSKVTPSIVARGLTTLALPADKSVASSGRWYRRRGGPYKSPADMAVWVEKPPIESRFSGESLLASWVTPNHRPRLLLSDKNAHARCVDPRTGDVQWERVGFYSNHASYTLPAADGATDLLRNISDSFEFLDAATGRLRFEIDMRDTGNIQQLNVDSMDPERVVYALADGKPSEVYRRALQRKEDRGFELLKIDRLKQRLVWSLQCMIEFDASGRRQPEWIQVDVNDDDVTDIVMGDTDQGNVVLRAIDGRDGAILWSTPLVLSSVDWPRVKRWPIMSVVACESQAFAIVVDAVDGDSKSIDLKAIRLQDGRETGAFRMPIQNPPVASAEVEIQTLSPKKRDGRFAVRRGINYDGYFSTVLQLDASGGKITEVDRFPASIEETFYADTDDDQVLEKIDIFEGKTIEVRRGDNNELLGSSELPRKIRFRGVETIADKSLLVGRDDGQEHWWIELPSGKIALRGEPGLRSSRHAHVDYPRLLHCDDGTLLIGRTPEGPICMDVDLGLPRADTDRSATSSVAMIAPHADPRYKRALRFVGMYEYRSFSEVLSLAARSALAIILPMLMVLPVIKTRQCSLRRLLLAPAVVIMAMISWRSILAEQRGDAMTNFMIGVFTVASVWGIWFLLRQQRWKTLGVVVAVGGVLGVLFMMMQQIAFASETPELIGIWTLSNWGVSVLAVLGQLVMPITVMTLGYEKLVAFIGSSKPSRQGIPPVMRSR